jgi:peptidoglycan hydrolase-like protein with peptidoglycan-binding domain
LTQIHDAGKAAKAGPITSAPVTSAGHEGEKLSPILQLQRLVGNRAIAGALAVQRDLKLADGPSEAVGNLQQQLNGAGAAPRLAITGRFDAPTETAVKAFQKAKTLGETGVVDAATQKALDTAAPVITAGGAKTVEHGVAEARGTLVPGAGDHPDLAIGAKGAGVKELQERLNNSPTMAPAARAARAVAKDVLKVDGVFGPITETALKQFQTDQAIAPPSGVAQVGTWAKLVAAGAASQGRTEYEWREVVEGVQNVGGRAKYEWKLTADKLQISANINFVTPPPTKMADVSGRIHEWVTEIKDIWSSFKAVNKKNPAQKINVDFEARRKTGDFNVNIHKSLAKDNKRSDAANWYTGDGRRGLAAHEYGHLIGLADEYNRDEGQFMAVTGQEPPVGKVTGDPAKATQLAKDIKSNLPIADAKGLALAIVIHGGTGGKQGGFSKLVAKEYASLNGGNDLQADISAAFNAKGITGFTSERAWCMTPFLYSTGSIMGTMTEAATAPAPGKHDHSVEPRHIKPFVDIIIRERVRAGVGAGEEWEPQRR